jgi:hypothetical protein
MAGGKSRGRPVPPRIFFCLRAHESEQVGGRQDVWTHDRRVIRIHPSHRRLSPAGMPSTCASRMRTKRTSRFHLTVYRTDDLILPE